MKTEIDFAAKIGNNIPPIEISSNPNIGALGTAEYQDINHRVKGFCPTIIWDPDIYAGHLAEVVLPLANSSGASRIIDRAIVAKGLDFSPQAARLGVNVEAIVPLGGDWENFTWAMVGGNKDGRILSSETSAAIRELAHDAAQLGYEKAKPLPQGFTLESIRGVSLSGKDLDRLVEIFSAAFSDYITPMTDPDYLSQWTLDESVMPFIIRNEEGLIVAISNADLAQIQLRNVGRPFRFMEIGDSATHPDFRGAGLNRIIKTEIIRAGKRLGFDSIHTETRACWGAPNYGNSKNGMTYCGTLWNNCVIRGPEDIPESRDPRLSDWAKKFGTLNVWAMTPANPHWKNF